MKKDSKLDSAQIDAAVQSVGALFSIDLGNEEQREANSLAPHDLTALVAAGASALGAKTPLAEQIEIEANPLFTKVEPSY